MGFPLRTNSYGKRTRDIHPTTPYDRAKKEWDDRIGNARVQASNWRLIALLTLLILGLTIGGLVYVVKTVPVKTYIVEIDSYSMPGRVQLASDHYEPTDAQVGYFVGQVVRLVRQRPMDPVVLRNNWTRAFRFLAADAVSAMNAYASEDSGLSEAQRNTARVVQISNILQKSKNTYQVRWIERTFANGIERQRDQYTGLFHVNFRPPHNEVDVFHNPLGVYITSFSWSKEFTSPVTREQVDPPHQPRQPNTQDQP